MARRRTNIRRRGDLWVVSWRNNGEQLWKSFPSEEQAELFAAKHVWPRRARETYRPPVKVTFGEAAAEWLRHGENEGGKRGAWKVSTRRDYRSALAKHFAGTDEEPGWLRHVPLGQITPGMIERWRAQELAEGMSHRNAVKLVAILHGVFERARRAYRLEANPIDDVEPLGVRYSGRLDFYSVEEVWALVRAAGSEQDAALFLTAAFTGLRMGELLALRFRDIAWEAEAIRVEGSVSFGELTTPKSGKVRSVPMIPDVTKALDGLSQRERFTGDDELVFPGPDGGYQDGSRLRRRYKTARKAAGLRELRFHDLRHCFGSLAIDKASIVQVQHWMGHADVQTTMRYLHHKSRADEASLLADAFKVTDPASGLQAPEVPTGATAFHTDAADEEEAPAQLAFPRNEAERSGRL